MFADYHVHSSFSDDSFYEMEDVVRDAVALGLEEICFTDHVDYGIKPDQGTGAVIPCRDGKALANVDYPLYVKTVRGLQAAYRGKISVKLGLEFGIQTGTIAEYEALFRRYPFDFIILSVHEVENRELWTQEFQTGLSQREYNERYYQEILELVKRYKNYSVLGHLDHIVRYDECGVYPFEQLRPIITRILERVIADGKGIEVNTSSHRYGLADLTPSRAILRLYKKLGGEIITIGSDCHEPADLGAYIAQTKDELRELGFTSFYTFSSMTPEKHNL